MPRTKSRLSAEQRKEAILEAALNVFARKGYNGARTKEIAQEAGISETLVFRHFGSKENLYREALDHLFSPHPVDADMAPAMAVDDDHEVLYQLARHVIEHGRRDGRIVRLNLFSGLEGMGMAKGESTPVQALEDYLLRRMKEGGLRKMDARLAARYFMYAVFLYVSDIQLKLTGPPSQVSDHEAAEALVDVFLGGLLPRA